MDPTVEKLLKLPNKQKIAVIVCILLAIAAGFYFGLIKPKQQELTEFRTKLVELQTQVEQDRKVAENLPKLQSEYARLNKELQSALNELPNKQEIPSLLTSITSAGKGAGLDFLLFKPRAEEPKDFYAAVPVDISVSGTFQAVAKFFVAVSELSRIVNINNVVVSDIKSTGDQTALKVTCLATTFRFMDKKEIKNEKKK